MKTAIDLTAIIISSIALVVAIASLVLVIAMRISTHKVEFRPMEIHDPFKEDDFKPFTEPDADVLDKGIKLSEDGVKKKKKKDTDPLDEVLESTNF